MNTSSVNCHCNKVKHCDILHTGLLAITLLLIITIICYHYAKQKDINRQAILKWKIMNLKKLVLKSRLLLFRRNN